MTGKTVIYQYKPVTKEASISQTHVSSFIQFLFFAQSFTEHNHTHPAFKHKLKSHDTLDLENVDYSMCLHTKPYN